MTYRISTANTGTGFSVEIDDIGQNFGVITASRSDRGQTSRTVLALSELLCVDIGRVRASTHNEVMISSAGRDLG